MSGSSAIMASATTGCGKRMQRIIAERSEERKLILADSTCTSCHAGKIVAVRHGKGVCSNCGKKVSLG